VILADSAVIAPENLVLGFLSKPASSPPPPGFDLSGSLTEATERAVMGVERAKISQALEDARGNRTLAAEKLNISTKTLLLKLRAHGLDS
jgi:DNA-binding NtrC family response regulator